MSADERRLQEEELRQHVRAPFREQFDQEFYAEFGQYPQESPLHGSRPVDTARRAKIEALATGGATEGERAAALAALERLDADAQDEADFEDALAHGEA